MWCTSGAHILASRMEESLNPNLKKEFLEVALELKESAGKSILPLGRLGEVNIVTHRASVSEIEQCDKRRIATGEFRSLHTVHQASLSFKP